MKLPEKHLLQMDMTVKLLDGLFCKERGWLSGKEAFFD